MERRDFPVLGRKVFFLNPPLSIGNYVFDALKQDQFEVYCVENYGVIKSLLKHYKDAICFIFIDDQLTLREWFNFIKSFEYEPELKSIFLGVISAKIRTTDKNKFIMNLKLPCGFTMLEGPVADICDSLKGILNVNGAKGRRQYIRLDCSENKNISGYVSVGLEIYNFKVQILSIAGFTCTISSKNSSVFKRGNISKNISLNVNRKIINCTGLVYDIKETKNASYVIVLFTKNTDQNSRNVISNFIYDVLKEKMDFNILHTKQDLTDYKAEVDFNYDKVNSTPLVKEESFDSPEANEILKNIGDLEDIPEIK